MATLPPPEEVHPDHKQPTPENIDDWSEEQLERWNEAQSQQLQAGAEQQRTEMVAEQRESLQALREAVTDDDEPETATVQLDQATVEVKTRIPGRLESKLDRIATEEQRDIPDYDAVREEMTDAILELIVDDEEKSGYRFTDRRVWEAFYDEYGSEGLATIFEQVSGPAMDRLERLEKFRGQQGRRSSR